MYFRELIAMFRRDLLPPSSGYSEIRGCVFPLKVCSNLVHQTSIPPKITILLLEAVKVVDFTVNFSFAVRICHIYFQTYLLFVTELGISTPPSQKYVIASHLAICQSTSQPISLESLGEKRRIF